MSIYFYNTLTAKKELFVPLNPSQVTFYTCGVTTYDYCHVGHARVYVVFDCVRRYLTYRGYHVRHVQNFTDIDDKIIRRSQELGEPWQSLTDRFVDACLADLAALHVLPADVYPRATAYISHMQTLIATLIDKGAAYVQDVDMGLGKDVFFSVSAAPDYGKLSKKVLDDLISGSRVDVSVAKRDPLDFVLWKAAKPGEPFWDSPWGPGRPGWHIECSAMVLAVLGETIDIHAGGQDLVFPHHENEICQSECATGVPFARYWLHNGFVTIRNEKMAKSAGNFFTIRSLLENFSGEEIRFFLLKTHYRAPLGFSLEGLEEAKQALSRLAYTCQISQSWGFPTVQQQQILADFEARFFGALDDDINTAEAIGVLFELNKYAHVHQCNVAVLMRRLGNLLGILSEAVHVLSSEALALAEARLLARKNKDYAESDRLRDVLRVDFGIAIEDTKDGYLWHRVGE